MLKNLIRPSWSMAMEIWAMQTKTVLVPFCTGTLSMIQIHLYPHYGTLEKSKSRQPPSTLRSTATPLLIQPFARTDFAKRSFRCAAPSVWNSLPASVFGSDSLSVFKSRLKHSYFVSPITSTHNRLPPAPRSYDLMTLYKYAYYYYYYYYIIMPLFCFS